MNKNIKLLSIKDASFHFYECMDANDWENASGYFETIILHYKSLNKKLKEIKNKKFTCEVKPCWDSKFKGINCIEDEDRYAFQRLSYDFRPSNRIWINKEDALILYNLFKWS